MTENILRELFYSLVLEKKISVVPIIPGEKRPGEYIQGKWRGMAEWERYGERLPTEIELEYWTTWPLQSLGVLTGEVSGILALDFDNRPDIIEQIEKVIPESPIKKKGAKGYTAFYKFNEEDNFKWALNGETIVEILCTGRQTLIPPSMHPSGVNYEWLTQDTLLNYDLEKLPIIDMSCYEAIQDIVVQHYKAEKKEQKTKSHTTSGNFHEDTPEDIKAALDYIPADDYHLWIKIGMAIASKFPGTEGFQLWDNWSKKSAKYKELEMIQKWRSFGDVSHLHLSSLFYEAQQHGYKQPKRSGGSHGERSDGVDVKVVREQQGESAIRQESNYQSSKIALPDDLIQNVPGLAGRIAEWINETAIFKQPALAVGASLTAVAALKAHRVRTQTNLRTNLYVVGICDSGGGKGWGMEQVENLLNEAGLTNIFSGEPVSDSAVLKSVKNNRGRRLIQWDELGVALQEMTTQKASSHKAAILGVMMKLFSKASGVYRGKEYADHDNKMKRADIDQPCLSVYGASTPGRFYGALSTAHTIDGFASRWIIMESDDPYPKRRKVGMSDVPAHLIRDVQELERLPTNDKPKGNLDETLVIRPRIVFYETDAEEIMMEAEEYFDSKRDSAHGKIEGLSAVWSRAAEHTAKLALTVEDGERISRQSVEWARDVVKFCVQNLCEVIMNQLADNEYQRSLNKILEIIRAAGPAGIMRSALYNRTRWLKTYERNDILDNLIESEQIEPVNYKSDTKFSIYYIAKPIWRG